MEKTSSGLHMEGAVGDKGGVYEDDVEVVVVEFVRL
jgi:hypothetical protein